MSRLYPAAKINLGLRILGRRQDGYHELSSFIIPLPALHDILDIRQGSGDGLELECGCDDIKDQNILQKTYDIFCQHKNFYPPLHARLEKRIPVGAGLGGGSSDAACFLRYLSSLCPDPATPGELISLGMKIGADVPFFLVNKPAWISGLGEIVNPLPCALPALHIVLVWPGLHISTRWAFETYDSQNGYTIPCLSGSKKDLTKFHVKDTQIFPDYKFRMEDILSNLYNDLEGALFSRYPPLEELKQYFLAKGALAAGMSGSGSSLYGIFPDKELARLAAENLREKYSSVYQIST